MSVAAVLVAHNAETWLPATLASIEGQSVAPDRVIVIDDQSTDGTAAIVRQAGLDPLPSRSRATDTVTRIAQNFVQGVQACGDCDVVILGDHDDVWLPDRVAHQVGLLADQPTALMVASDGRLVDAAGQSTGGTLRGTFPIPTAWKAWAAPERMRFALKHSIATGGASALRPSAYPDLAVPNGWLHDRWWSLVATACAGMLVDAECVIDYRVQDAQQVGLDVAAQGHGPVGRLAALLGQTRRSYGKQADLRGRLRPLAVDPQVAAVISLRNVL